MKELFSYIIKKKLERPFRGLLTKTLSDKNPQPKCAPGNQPHTRILHFLHCRSSEGNLGDDLQLGRRAFC
jgi:hypothetical protein